MAIEEERMQETIKAIISLLDPCDQVPDEFGEYIISSTIHALGSCSLSRGGSYAEKANYEVLNSELSDCTGIFRRKAKSGKNYAPSVRERIKRRERRACALKQDYENLCGLTEMLAKAHMISLRR